MTPIDFPGFATELNARMMDLSPKARIAALRETLPGRVVFTTSLGIEDQAITHMIATDGLDVEFATLDTGRMFLETYDVWTQTEARYGIKVLPFYPDAAATEALVARQGINGFYGSV